MMRPALALALVPLMMIPGLDDTSLAGIPLGQATPAGLLGMFIILIGLGRLVPRRTLDDAFKDRDGWREAHATSEAARVEMQETLNQCLALLQEAVIVLRALPQGVQRAREDKEHPS